MVAAFLTVAIALAVPREGVVDRIVAVVEGQPVTLSELELEARVQLVRVGGEAAATAPLDDSTLRAALELSIAQRLQAAEAERLQAFAPEPDALQRALDDLSKRFGRPADLDAFLARHEADRAQLSTLLSRILRAERLLDSKLQLRAQVSDAELRRYYDTHPAEHATPFEAARSQLRERLTRERYTQLAAAELEELRAGAQVRRIAPFAKVERP